LAHGLLLSWPFGGFLCVSPSRAPSRRIPTGYIMLEPPATRREQYVQPWSLRILYVYRAPVKPRVRRIRFGRWRIRNLVGICMVADWPSSRAARRRRDFEPEKPKWCRGQKRQLVCVRSRHSPESLRPPAFGHSIPNYWRVYRKQRGGTVADPQSSAHGQQARSGSRCSQSWKLDKWMNAQPNL
jgi:hypothetical protein